MEAKHDHSTHQHTDICAGFVVLPKGYAVLSVMDPGGMHHGGGHHQAGHQHGMADKKEMGDKAHMQHGMADKKEMDHKQHAQHDGGMKQADPLMGHQHGDDIPTGKEMLCVPIGDTQSISWTPVSASPNLHITAKSDKGFLAQNSRANEALSFNIMRDGKPVDPAKVRVVVRMPHHDRRMPGGHGPANDPDVQGFEAMAKGKGGYTGGNRSLPTSLCGEWPALSGFERFE